MNLVRTDNYVLNMNVHVIVANHLDLGAVVWLEAYLSTYNHILVVRLTSWHCSMSHLPMKYL